MSHFLPRVDFISRGWQFPASVDEKARFAGEVRQFVRDQESSA